MRKTTAILNGKDQEPSQGELETIWAMMEADAEDGWLIPDYIGNVEQEVDEDDLRKLLKNNMVAAREAFGYFIMYGPGATPIEQNFPEHLCGYYIIKAGRHMFIQWAAE